MALPEELGSDQQGDQRLGEEEHHDDVDDRGQGQGEREVLDPPDGDEVEDDATEEGHQVGDHDGAPGPRPGALDGGPDRSPFTNLVAKSLEVDDERVGGDADRHDHADDTARIRVKPIARRAADEAYVMSPATARLSTLTRPSAR